MERRKTSTKMYSLTEPTQEGLRVIAAALGHVFPFGIILPGFAWAVKRMETLKAFWVISCVRLPFWGDA